MANQITATLAMIKYFTLPQPELGLQGKKIDVAEAKKLSAEDREELGQLCIAELNRLGVEGGPFELKKTA